MKNSVLKTGELESAGAFLSSEDFSVLLGFYEQSGDSDADGYTASKQELLRLAELGVVRSHGRNVHSVTTFGHWLIETTFAQHPSLPLQTAEDYNASQKATMDTVIYANKGDKEHDNAITAAKERGQ